MAGLFMVARLKDRLLTTVRDLRTGLGLVGYPAEPKLLILVKDEGGDCPPPLSSLALLWLWKKWDGEGETGEEAVDAEEKDGMSSTSSMSKDLFKAAGKNSVC